MYTLRNTEARSRHICFSGKAIIIKQHVCVCVCVCVVVALSIQHSMRMRHIVICCAPLCKFFSHYFINGTIFEKKLY